MTSWSTVTETFGLKTSDIVLTVGSTIDIDASADIVFEIITNFFKLSRLEHVVSKIYLSRWRAGDGRLVRGDASPNEGAETN